MRQLALALSLALAGCGYAPPQQGKDATVSQAPDAPQAPAQSPQAQPEQASSQTTEVQVTVKVSSQGGSAPRQAAPMPDLSAAKELTFADAATGAFMPDGSFAYGSGQRHGEQEAAYCSFETSDCSGRCWADNLASPLTAGPAKYALFFDGHGYLEASGSETDEGARVLNSYLLGGSCRQGSWSAAHSWAPRLAWEVPAGDSTVPSEHAAQ